MLRRALMGHLLLPLPALAQPASIQARALPRNIRIVVPWPPGGTSDIVARAIVAHAAEQPGAPTLVIDNRGGGASVPGTAAIAAARPDGSVVGVIDTPVVTNPFLLGAGLPYDITRDFSPIGEIATAPVVLAAHPSLRATTVAELAAETRDRGHVALGHSGNGTTTHLAAIQLMHEAGLPVSLVGYRGGGPQAIALIAGEVAAGFISPAAAKPHVEQGRLKALAVTGAARSASFPDVPTFGECSLPGVDATGFFACVGPRGIDPALIDGLASLLVHPARRDIGLAERLSGLGYTPVGGNPAQLSDMLASQLAKWGAFIRRHAIDL